MQGCKSTLFVKSNCPACCVKLVKIPITLEPYVIFGSILRTYLFLILSSHPSMQNGGERSPSIIFAGQCILVKMLITLEPHGIF